MRAEATAVAIDGRAVLLTGPSGAGKSDLALRLIDAGAQLIGDDAVAIGLDDEHLVAMPFPLGAGKLAVRSIGIIRVPHRAEATPLSLAVALQPLAIPETFPLLGRAGPWHGRYVPQIALYPFEASAASKVLLALQRFGL